ncbi:hypothetical protein [Streptomyces sp. A5-4]|uniref:hypothetical protein n=1 Tax=Streptomyces sp. A5-4 TaxID=3384771 RepID=UPI003DA7B5EE
MGSIRDGESGTREPFIDPVCKPCGESYVRRPALKARIVPLRIYTPTPEFKDIAGGHRLVDHPFHEAACHDCLLLGSVEYFRQGRDKGLHGCARRPESVNSHVLPKPDNDQPFTLNELAGLWWRYTTHDVGMGIEDWCPIANHPCLAATFTFRDREYGLRHSQDGTYVWAEKLENRGRMRPDEINVEYRETYKQVVFRVHGLENKYGSPDFITWTPGREGVMAYAAEGQLRSVLRLTGLTRPGDPLAEVTDAVCDTFGAIAQIKFQERIYE